MSDDLDVLSRYYKKSNHTPILRISHNWKNDVCKLLFINEYGNVAYTILLDHNSRRNLNNCLNYVCNDKSNVGCRMKWCGTLNTTADNTDVNIALIAKRGVENFTIEALLHSIDHNVGIKESYHFYNDNIDINTMWKFSTHITSIHI